MALAATVVAAGILAGSAPASGAASDDAVLSASGAQFGARSADADTASRGDRSAFDPAVPPPPIAGADQALVPPLSEAFTPCPTEGFGGVKPHVAQAGWHLVGVFGLSESDVGGVAQRPGNPNSDHPRGLALDFMVDNSTGDALSAYAEAHTVELGINYILWQVPDHYDHVHISFNGQPGSGMTC